MAEFEEKLNQILSSPSAMEQIMALAGSLSGDPPPSGGQQAGQPTQTAQSGQSPPPFSGGMGGMGGLGDLGSLFSSVDPGMIAKVLPLIAEFQHQDDDRTRLLEAMRPFLSPQRQGRLEQAVQITRLTRVLRTAMTMFREDQDV